MALQTNPRLGVQGQETNRTMSNHPNRGRNTGPRCLNCNNPIPKASVLVHAPTLPQSLVPIANWDYTGNHTVIARRYALIDPVDNNFVIGDDEPVRTARAERRLYAVSVWDFTYVPVHEFFCTNICAALFGRAAAQTGWRREKMSSRSR